MVNQDPSAQNDQFLESSKVNRGVFTVDLELSLKVDRRLARSTVVILVVERESLWLIYCPF